MLLTAESTEVCRLIITTVQRHCLEPIASFVGTS